MRGQPTTFWGKLRRDGDAGPVRDWHPLFDHCADVAAVVQALLDLPVWRARLARLAGVELGQITVARLCVLAALHDIGKLNVGFQAKGRPELGPTAGHVTEALAALTHGDVFACLSELGAWGDGASHSLLAAVCHHGRPFTLDAAAASWQHTWWRPRGDLDPRAGAAELLERCHAWYPDAFASSVTCLPEIPAFSHAFAGLVMLADWIASDTSLFPYAEPDDGDRAPRARTAAHAALTALGLDIDQARRRDSTGRDAFARVARRDFLPRPAQQAMLHLPVEDRGSITVLEAETGSGKTEAALARFVTLFDAGLVDGLYFALPTRSAATQMHERVFKAVQQAFVLPPAVVLAVPGYLTVDDTSGKKLARFEVLWPDKDRLRYRGWAAENSKRYLAASIAVGTIDQVLLSSLMVGHAHLRATALFRQLLVVDEVHASDAYMSRILQEVLARHLAAGGHALLLSATLGGEARERLLRPGERVAPPSLQAAEETAYPCVTHRSTTTRRVAIPLDTKHRVVSVATERWLADPEALAATAVRAGAQGAKVLIIKNTVAGCIRTQIAVECAASDIGRTDILFMCAGVAAPHHARFARPDREALDGSLDDRLREPRPAGGCVVVATQTVQQSLDIDADILFSDLSPADVLLQRFGRLHRHDRHRPDGFESPRAVVLVPENRNLSVLIGRDGRPRNHHGLGSVYPDLRILEATWRLLDRYTEWRVPAMNRHLVEHSLHSSILDGIVAEGGATWVGHAAHAVGSLFGQARQADLNIVDWSQQYCDTVFPSALDQRITTRLGEGDRRVFFNPAFGGPFGREVSELTLPARWWTGVSDNESSATDVCSTTGVTRFRFGTRAFVYDRLGLRPDDSERAEESKEESHDDAPRSLD